MVPQEYVCARSVFQWTKADQMISWIRLENVAHFWFQKTTNNVNAKNEQERSMKQIILVDITQT